MGNTDSVVASGVKKQASPAATTGVYQFINVKGKGELVDLMKEAAKTKDYSQVEKCISERVVEQLYNGGQGRLVPIDYLIMLRNRDRPKHKMLEENRKVMDENGDFPPLVLPPEDPTLDKKNYDKSKYRFCCYNLEYMGAVQEGILLLSLLNSTSIHSELAHRLLARFPLLINDVYLSEEYYGESALHIAIVNEDPAMVKLLLDYGIDVHQRCFGNFMSPEDQKSSRYDVLGDEVVQTGVNTNYEGYIYWGEYPLSFAACLGQEECFRLILSRGANPDLQDTNGNNTIHMMVIFNNIDMFNVVYECGGSLNFVNRQGLVPLTLAAKLAKKDIFSHILQVTREIYWQIGNITCCAYPLPGLDSFDTSTGQVDDKSTLNLIVFGEKLHHLDMLDGVVVDLLNAKWDAYVRKKFKRMMIFFTLYFILNACCFLLRPSVCTLSESPDYSEITNEWQPVVSFDSPLPGLSTGYISTSTLAMFATLEGDTRPNSSLQGTLTTSDEGNGGISLEPPLSSTKNPTEMSSTLNQDNMQPVSASSSALQSDLGENDVAAGAVTASLNTSTISTPATSAQQPAIRKQTQDKERCTCYLWRYNSVWDLVRWCLELATLVATLIYVLQAVKETRFLGVRMFFETVVLVPSRVVFLLSCLVKLLMVVARLACLQQMEDVLAVLAMLGTAPYYLFFCRGYKTVGPFVTMVYKMIVGDLLRFVTIYMVFVMGFSQAYFCIYRSYSNPSGAANPMQTPTQSILLMFVASLSNFGDLFNNLKYTKHALVGQVLFLMYMIIAAILLINMLIAMMGNTYQKIAELKNEWMRQWARIVLVVEREVSPEFRLQSLRLYSRPMTDGVPALVLRKQQTDVEMEIMREISEMKIRHKRNRLKRSPASAANTST